MKISACIFNLDGSIVDSSKYHFMAWKKLAIELGFDIEYEYFEKLKYFDDTKALEVLLKSGNIQLDEKEKMEALKKKNTWFLNDIQKITYNELLPGVYEFLLDLKTNHIKLALGTECKQAKLILQRIELYMLFDSVIDGNKVTKGKPDPEIYLKASDELGLKPAECIVFENSKAGIEAVHNAGMICVGLGIHEDLKLADIMIPGFATIEWKDILKRLNH